MLLVDNVISRLYVVAVIVLYMICHILHVKISACSVYHSLIVFQLKADHM